MKISGKFLTSGLFLASLNLAPLALGQNKCGNDNPDAERSGCGTGTPPNGQVCTPARSSLLLYAAQSSSGTPGGPTFYPAASAVTQAPDTTQNFVLPLTSDGRNDAIDLRVHNSVGDVPLELRRYYKSRSRSGLGNPFGQGQTWSHSYSWGIHSTGAGRRSVAFPTGRVMEFTEWRSVTFDGAPAIIHLPQRGRGERLYQNGPGDNTFTLVQPNGARQVFERVFLNGSNTYHPRYGEDTGGRRQTYQTDARGRIIEVADQAGNTLTLQYGGVRIFNREPITLGRVTAAPNDGWNEITVSNPQTFRWLQASSSTSSFFNLAEIEFYGPDQDGNETLISGSTYGTGPSHRSTQSSTFNKAFDGDPSTGYVHNNRSGGIAGIDLRSGSPRTVSKIRFRPRSSGPTAEPMASLIGTTFEGLVNTPVIVDVLQRVESSDGRVVNYIYGTQADTSVKQTYLVLSGVDYNNDGEITQGPDATFSWVISDKGRAPNVGTFYEPRTTSGIPHLQFSYHDTREATRGQVSEVREASSGEIIFSFEPEEARSITFPGGRNILVETNGDGAPTSRTDASGHTWLSNYNPDNGFIQEQIDPAGRTTTMDFNFRGLRTSITRPDGLMEEIKYDANGLHITSVTRSAPGQPAHTTRLFRDPQNRVTRIEYPDGSFVTHRYNALGLLISKREHNGTLTTLDYNAAGLVSKATLASGTPNAESWTYEYFGDNDPTGSPGRLLKSVTDPRGRTTSYEYENRGLRTKVTYPDGSFQITGYDFAGNATFVTDSALVNGAPIASRTSSTTYDSFNRMTTSTDQAGHTTQYFYGDGGVDCGCYNSGGPTLIISPAGRVTMKVYDEQYRVTSETTGLVTAGSTIPGITSTTEYLYDSVGNLAMMVEPGGVIRSYNYDPRDRMISETVDGTNGRGATRSYTTFYTYDPFGNRLSLTQPGGRTTTMTYDSLDRMLTSTDPLGTTMAYTYDIAGNPIALTEDAAGSLARTTTMEYDLLNRLTRTTYPDGTAMSRTYYPGGEAASSTDELGRTTLTDTVLTTWQDSAGDTWTSFASTYTDALGKVSISHPSPMGTFGGTTRTVSPMGRVSETYLSTDGNTTTTITGLVTASSTLTADPTVTAYTYDEDDLMLTRTIDPAGLQLTTSYIYDSRGSVSSMTDPLGRETTMEHDARRNTIKTNLPDGRFHTATYDALDRLTIATDPKNQTTTYVHRFDTGVLASLTDPRGNTTRWTHNALVQILTKRYPTGDTHTYTYDSLHRMQTHRTPKGETCTYSYDLRDRQVKMDWNTTTPDTTTTYLANGLPASIDNTVSRSDYTYTVRNELTADTQTLTGQPARTVAYSYDADGLRLQMNSPSGSPVDYTWTARAQLADISRDGPPPLATYGYDAAGRLLTTAHENGITEAKTYNTASELLSNHHVKAGTTASGHAYTYDLTGRRTAETFPGSSTAPRTYGYDTADQVTSADYGNNTADTYDYDPMGNRNTFTRSGANPSAVTYTANSANQYTTVTGLTAPPVHDANGNLTSQNGIAYSWDSENRLLRTSDGTTQNTYTYDGRHRRVSKKTFVGNRLTASTHFIYDGWNVIEEWTTDLQSPTKTHTWGTDLSGTLQGAGGVGGLLLTEETGTQSTTAYHFHYDGNGNVTEITDLTGTPAASYRYDAFGNTLVATGSYAEENKYRFSTKPLDAEITTAPLYYYGYRYYDPVTGRWPSRDPIGERGGVNLYGFLDNNLLSAIDLLGLVELDLDTDYDIKGHGDLWDKLRADGKGNNTEDMVTGLGGRTMQDALQALVISPTKDGKCKISGKLKHLLTSVDINIRGDRDPKFYNYDRTLAHELTHVSSYISRLKKIVETVEGWEDLYDSYPEAEEALEKFKKDLQDLIDEANRNESGHNDDGGYGTPPEDSGVDWNQPGNLPRTKK